MAEVQTRTEILPEAPMQAPPSDNVVQQSVPMDMQSQMHSNLERALDKLSGLEMPVEPKPRAQKPKVEAAPRATEPEPKAEPAHEPEPKPEPIEARKEWGPAQQKALQDVLNSNARMEKELKEIKAEAGRYKGMVETAQSGDMLSFAEQAQLSEQDMLEALGNGGKQPVSRPYVKKLETTVHGLSEKLAALEQQLSQRDQQARTEKELAAISQHLNSQADYGMLKRIPDAAERIQSLIREREAAARDRGEVAPFSVDEAAKMFKGSLIQSLKQFLDDDQVKRELGILGDQVTPDTVKPSRPTKALTGRLTSQGSQVPQQQEYTPDAQLRKALGKLMGA